MSCHVMSDIPYLLNVLVHFTADTTKFNLCAKCETLMGSHIESSYCKNLFYLFLQYEDTIFEVFEEL